MNAQTLKRKIRSGAATYGSWITLGSPAVAEVMADAGFDWLVVDMEHSAITLAEAQELIRVIALKGAVPLVRVTNNDPNLIKRVLDAGAEGVVVPMVNSAKEAAAAVAAAYYPPRGSRGVGLARAQGYGFAFDAYARRAAKDTIVVVQIEHVRAAEAADEILRTPGIDAFIIGPYDLSGSLGVPGKFEDPRVRAALERTLRAGRAAGVAAGYHVIPPSAAEVRRRHKEGYRFLAASLDTLYLGAACRSALSGLPGKRRPS